MEISKYVDKMVLVSYERWKQLLDNEKKCSDVEIENSEENIEEKSEEASENIDNYNLIPPGIPDDYTAEFITNKRKRKRVKIDWKELPKTKK